MSLELWLIAAILLVELIDVVRHWNDGKRDHPGKLP